jgi:sporulation protein YlmC with PRC-barrel domain
MRAVERSVRGRERAVGVATVGPILVGQTGPDPGVVGAVVAVLVVLVAVGVALGNRTEDGEFGAAVDYPRLEVEGEWPAGPASGGDSEVQDVTTFVGREMYTADGVYVGSIRDLVLDIDREVVSGLALEDVNDDIEALSGVDDRVVIPYGLVQSAGDIVQVPTGVTSDGGTRPSASVTAESEGADEAAAPNTTDARGTDAADSDAAQSNAQNEPASDAADRPPEHEQLHEDIAAARASLESDWTDPVAAWRSLFDLETDLEVLRERAASAGAATLRDAIDALESERAERMAADYERIQERYVPDRIPGAPDVSVDHDTLTDEESLGSGGTADVNRARLPTVDGDVTLAIKRPRMADTLHAELAERVLAEAETWDKLDDHDHIVGVVDYGAEPLPWIAMEYMDGGHLGRRAGDLPLPQALWTAIAVAEGVRHAHRRGIAHLDLKPENVLFREVEDAWDVPKVADWGLSKKLIDASQEVDGMTVSYAAPEQLADDRGPTDDRTDIYGLGAVYYELFTGRPPFEGKPARVVQATLEEQPDPPSTVADVPAAIDEPLLTALAKDRQERYDNVAYLRDELRGLFEP